MPKKYIKGFDEYMRQWFKRTANHLIDGNMDLDESMNAAYEETRNQVVKDLERDFTAQMLKLIFGK